ncbi:MAG TPA: NUDIX domain-containing protein [Candidatus Saccharimonadales bacterium]|jgi:8-oxo-dGTP pyrophosphatase MutT (NUDIX family)|nr:NUDIX domain-containing protein [Candidatus Saccharimonadales bacterium]
MQRPKPIKGIKKFVHNRRSSIQDVLQEPTAGGLIFRRNGADNHIEFLLIQDAKGRWTIPKGHIESGETPEETAAREIIEETGIIDMRIMEHLGKIHFRYRRESSLVLMTTEIFLAEATGDSDKIEKEDWMKNIKWLTTAEAIDKIEYDDITKLLLIALKKIKDARR